ncbi:MAG: hypothetical protein AB7F53_07060 [Nitrososphaeraceae archaeon]
MNFIKGNTDWEKIKFIMIAIPLVLSFFLLPGDSYPLQDSIINAISNDQNHYSVVKASFDDYISDVLPAKIQMIYENQTFDGKPIFYIYRGDSSFSDFQIPQFNFSNINTKIINLKNSSEVLFNITDYPPIITPSYLGVTAYKDTGETAQIIKNEDYNITKINDASTINLKEGEYTLIATATWDGATEDVEGFQLNAFKINVKP